MRIVTALLALGIALAQNTAPPRHDEVCGHECRCVRRTFKVREEHRIACEQRFPNFRTDKVQKEEWLKCVASQPQHCEIVKDRTGKYPHPYLPCEPGDGKDCGVYQDPESGSTQSTGEMDVRCTAACKKHDCKCDDGPVCKDVP